MSQDMHGKLVLIRVRSEIENEIPSPGAIRPGRGISDTVLAV